MGVGIARWRCGLAGLALTLIAGVAGAVRADQVVLQDGSVIVGTVEHVANGVLLIKTEFAGDLRIVSAKVKGITTDRPFSVQTKAGETSAGTLNYSADSGQQLIGGAADRDIPIPFSAITTVWPESGQNPSAEALPEPNRAKAAPLVAEHQKQITELQAKQRTEELALMKFPTEADYWSGKLEAGVMGKGGNSDTFSSMIRFELNRIDPDDRLKIFTQGNYAVDSGETSANDALGGVHVEHDLDPKWFVWGKAEIEHDELEHLSWRLTATAGVGRWWIREEKQDLKTRFGIGYQHEDYFGDNTEDDIILDLGVDYRLTITEWLEIKHTTDWYPTIDDPIKDWRLVSETAGEIPLNPEKTWKIRAGVRAEYKNRPPEDVDSRLDTTYFANLVWDWK